MVQALLQKGRDGGIGGHVPQVRGVATPEQDTIDIEAGPQLFKAKMERKTGVDPIRRKGLVLERAVLSRFCALNKILHKRLQKHPGKKKVDVKPSDVFCKRVVLFSCNWFSFGWGTARHSGPQQESSDRTLHAQWMIR